jgi:hypothetical protein
MARLLNTHLNRYLNPIGLRAVLITTVIVGAHRGVWALLMLVR